VNLKQLREKAQEEYQKLVSGKNPVIYVGAATCGLAAGAGELLEIIPQELKRLKIKAQIVPQELKRLKIKAQIVPVGCIGMCCFEPMVYIQKPGVPQICYSQVTPEKLRISKG